MVVQNGIGKTQFSFREISGGRNLVRDNSKRWNSWYMMISTATNLKTAITIFCHQYRENDEDLLSEKDWQDLQNVKTSLYFSTTRHLSEGRSATIDKVLPTMDFLLEQFETATCTYMNDPLCVLAATPVGLSWISNIV
jgi:hypothetical protein